jgi:hypothetical protein
MSFSKTVYVKVKIEIKSLTAIIKMEKKKNLLSRSDAALTTDEPSFLFEIRQRIFDCIFHNQPEELAKIRLNELDLNFMEVYPDQQLDELVSPLALASFMGRIQIVEMLIEAGNLNLDLAT